MAVDVLVTGGSGVLGRYIVQILRSSQYKVVACGRVAGGATEAHWDVAKEDAPEPDCEPSVVVHAAAMLGSYQQSLMQAVPLFDVNVNGTLRVAKWCCSRGVQRLFLISSAIVYGEWSDTPKVETDQVNHWLAGPYASSKWCAEQAASLVKSSGVQLSILRLSSLYGPGYGNGLIQRLIRQGRQTGKIGLEPPFDDSFDFLHVSDAARTVKSTIEHSQAGLWNVGSGSLTTIQDVAETCANVVNAQVTFSNMISNRSPRVLNWVDDSRARTELGHCNEMSLERGTAEIARSMPQP